VESSPQPLIERIRRGDEAALAEYIAGRRLQLLAYINRRLGAALKSRIEADDIFQEANLDAIRRIGELAAVDRDPFGWLCQIAEQRLVDAHRRLFGAQKRSAGREVGLETPADDTRHSPLIDLLVASMTTPSAAFSRDQKELQLADALQGLPEEGREALRLRYIEGLPTKEIASRLGKTDGAVRVLLTRSLNRLQGVLEG
jgi:RNA polymerase sigma-70 factor (ECF subfamily)